MASPRAVSPTARTEPSHRRHDWETWHGCRWKPCRTETDVSIMNDLTEQEQPAIAQMAILFGAYCMLGLIADLLLFVSFRDELGWNIVVSLVLASGLVLSVLAAITFAMVQNPRRSTHPDSPVLFHLYQAAVVGTCFAVAYVGGYSEMTELRWIGFVFEIIVGCFYLAYIGFSFALRRPPSMQVYLGIICVAVSAAYAFQTASR